MARSVFLRLSVIVARGLIPAGAALVLAGVVSAWAQVTLFRHIDILLPGLLFIGGDACLTVAILVLLGGRRYPILCAAGAVLVLLQTHAAARAIPPRIKSQLIGAQMAAYPLNRLLDQFHLPNMDVANWGVPDARILGSGLHWAQIGGWALLGGALLGLPSDPALVWTMRRTRRVRCRDCGAAWRQARDARFCPSCGCSAADPNAPPVCPRCAAPAAPSDHYCIACGTPISP